MRTLWLILKGKRGKRPRQTGGTGKQGIKICFTRLNVLLREMFVDTNRGMAVVMGEKDNKKAIDKRKKSLIKEKLKYGKAVEQEVELGWDHYYEKVIFC